MHGEMMEFRMWFEGGGNRWADRIFIESDNGHYYYYDNGVFVIIIINWKKIIAIYWERENYGKWV